MNSINSSGLRSVCPPFLLLWLLVIWSPVSSAVTIDQFLLQDNTLLLNQGKLLSGDRIMLRADLGRTQIRRFGLRREFGREMIRMGREFNLRVGIRANQGRTYSSSFLDDIRVFGLRRDLRADFSQRAIRKSRQLLTGQYLLGTRTSGGIRETLFGNYEILGNSMVWSVTDQSRQKVFAMSNFALVPEPSSLLLVLGGLIGLPLAMFHKRRKR